MDEVNRIGRRGLLAGAAAMAGLSATRTAIALDAQVARRGPVKQSVVHWCFAQHWSVEQTCRIASRFGCRSIELITVDHWDTLKAHGLTCAIARGHGFVNGMNNPAHHAECLAVLRSAIDAAAAASVPNVISFTGFATTEAGTVGPERGMRNCVEGYKKLMGHAEQRGVNVCLEMLNSRVDEEMKGHPGYQGDDIEYCLDIVRKVDSPRMKLLFDIYHVQIMHGDVIRRIRECAPYIGHVHTAGNPGRGELDDRQEINYRPIIAALVESG